MSGAALPFRQIALPVGWDGSGCSASKVPSLSSARAPQRDTHNGQNVGTESLPTHRLSRGRPGPTKGSRDLLEGVGDGGPGIAQRQDRLA